MLSSQSSTSHRLGNDKDNHNDDDNDDDDDDEISVFIMSRLTM